MDNFNNFEIEFVVDNKFIAIWCVKEKVLPKAFLNLLSEKFPQSIEAIKNWDFQDVEQSFLDEIYSEEAFKHYCEEAKDFCSELQEYFEKQKPVFKEFFQYIKLDYALQKNICFVLPKQFAGGVNLRNGCFVWGNCGKDNLDYALIYILHEYLHSVIEHGRRDDIAHSVIELVADKEFAIKLLGATYKGHSHMEYYHEKLLPYWNLFCGRSAYQIENSFEQFKKGYTSFDISYKINKYEKYRDQFKKMTLSEFADWAHKKFEKEEQTTKALF